MANDRNCYCRAGETTCGVCEVCGAPGHTRHHPGPRAYTGSWCDACYERQAAQLPGLRPLLWAALAAMTAFALWTILGP